MVENQQVKTLHAALSFFYIKFLDNEIPN